MDKNDSSNLKVLKKISLLEMVDTSTLDLEELCELENKILRMQKSRINKGSDLNLYKQLILKISNLDNKISEINREINKFSLKVDISKYVVELEKIEIQFRSCEEELLLPDSERLISWERRFWKMLCYMEKTIFQLEERFKNRPMARIEVVNTYKPLVEDFPKIYLEITLKKIIDRQPDFWGLIILQYNYISDKLNLSKKTNLQDILDLKSHYDNENFYEACNKIGRIYEKLIRHYRSYVEFGDSKILNSHPKETLYNHIEFYKRDFHLSYLQNGRLDLVYEIRNLTGHENKEYTISNRNFMHCLTALLEMMLLTGWRLEYEYNL